TALSPSRRRAPRCEAQWLQPSKLLGGCSDRVDQELSLVIGERRCDDAQLALVEPELTGIYRWFACLQRAGRGGCPVGRRRSAEVNGKHGEPDAAVDGRSPEDHLRPIVPIGAAPFEAPRDVLQQSLLTEQ